MTTTVIDAHAPCPYPPGSVGKVRVLAERFRLRLPLFRHDDAGDVDSPDELQGLFGRMKATQENGPLDEPAARQLVAEVHAGERTAAEVAEVVGVTRRAVSCAAMRLRQKKQRLQTA